MTKDNRTLMKAAVDSFVPRRKKANGGDKPRVGKEIRDAVLTPVVYAMRADGKKDEAEFIQLLAILATSPVFEDVDLDEFIASVDAIEAQLDDPHRGGGEKVVREAVGGLPMNLREASYAFAMRMLYADKVLHMAEIPVAENMPGWLGMDQKTAQKIRDVMQIMATAAPL